MEFDWSLINTRLTELRDRANNFFEALLPVEEEAKEPHSYFTHDEEADRYWNLVSDELKLETSHLQAESLKIIRVISEKIKTSSLLTEADERDLSRCAKGIRASLRLRNYRSWDTEVLHDEGYVLGVQPPGQAENESLAPKDAKKAFINYLTQINGMVELLEISPTLLSDGLPPTDRNITSGYRPNTAFIMMCMDSSKSELQDVYDTIKECFDKFGIKAQRADDIEHEEIITKRILDEISTAEFLLGDLTEERPSVYYEIGYAHAIGRRVMLYRKKGTSIHFDLVAYNCPEYENLRDLKKKLLRRLEHITNRKEKP